MDPLASRCFSAYQSGDEYKSFPTGQITQGTLSCQYDPGQAPLDPTIEQELNNFIIAPMPLPWSDFWYPVENTCPIPYMPGLETTVTERPSSRSTVTSTDTSSDPTYVPTPSPSPECVVLPVVSNPASEQTSQQHRRQRSSSSSFPFASIITDVDAAEQNLLQYVKDHKGEDIPLELLLALLEKQSYPAGTEGKGARDGPAGYRCRWTKCTKVVTRRDHARDHVATHVNLKPYECTKCTRGFLRPHDLTRHGKKCHIRRAEVRESCKAIDLFSLTRRFQNGACSKDSLTPLFSSLEPITTFEYTRAMFIEYITWVSRECYKMTAVPKNLSPLVFGSSCTMVNPVTVRFSDWTFSTWSQWFECPLHEVSCVVYKSQ